MKEKEQMSIGQDKKIESSTSYLLFFKNALKKISKPLLLILVLLFLNVGAKYPAMSESSASSTSIENTTGVDLKAEYEKYVKMYQEIYEQSVIQQIEFESEVLIPDHIDFKYVEYAYNVSQDLNISPRITFRLIFKESSFIDTVKSKVGAEGLMQLMPDTRKKFYTELRVDTMNLDKTQEDIYIGLQYIIYLQDFWRDRGNSEKNLMRLSIAAYNAGYGNVIKYKGVPPYKETQDFVYFILRPHSNPSFYANIIKKNEKKELS
jgi:hypothetical protein